jgi:uncharacterized protein with NRDE domain
MCTILLAYKLFKDHPLIVLANRDEFYKRPTKAAAHWEDHPYIYAGRDLVSGGTWMGVTTSGRFAAVTNYRDPAAAARERSRGELVAGFLKSDLSSDQYLQDISKIADDYSPFNLIIGEISASAHRLKYFSNRGDDPLEFSPGIYGLSNHLLDTPWPKVAIGKARFRAMLEKGTFDRETAFEILADETIAEDGSLPSTGIPLAKERMLSAIFTRSPDYGTRCSTVLTFDDRGRWEFDERAFI